MRAPAEFVVTRHRITHPEEPTARVADHTGLHPTSVSRVLERLRDQHIYTEDQKLAHLRTLSERPRPKEISFDVPNPTQLLEALEALWTPPSSGATPPPWETAPASSEATDAPDARAEGAATSSVATPPSSEATDPHEAPFLLGGEDAAVHDGYNLVPEHHLIYIEPDHWSDVASAAKDVLARVAPASAANLTVRERDPWLTPDPTGRFVERGQRLLDYQESKHVQLARSLEDLG